MTATVTYGKPGASMSFAPASATPADLILAPPTSALDVSPQFFPTPLEQERIRKTHGTLWDRAATHNLTETSHE